MDCPARPVAGAERPHLELADIFRAYGDRLEALTPRQQQVVQAILTCHTAALGGHIQAVDHCGHQEISYNSCRDRHCPKCQGLDEARWVEAQQADLLPVAYFHVVFTVPESLHPLFRHHPKRAYDLLFSAVAATLQEVALTPHHLGARIGLTAILHTWTQTLRYHPHVHCLVPGGGLDPGGMRWVSCNRRFFLPVRVLSRVFRGKLLAHFEQALARGAMHVPQEDGTALLRQAARKRWVVYSKPLFAGPDQVLKYLGRYTHRIAISNDRLVSMHEGHVTFRWKDRAHGNQEKQMTLEAGEFLRRFLLQVLPPHLVRVRHYGFLANAVRRRQVARCRELLGVPPQERTAHEATPAPEPWQDLLRRLTGKDVTRCPPCRQGRLVRTEWIPAATPREVLPGGARAP